MEIYSKVPGWRLNTRVVTGLVKSLMNATGLSPKRWAIGIGLVSSPAIKAANHQYRNKAKPTDILSFKYYEGTPSSEQGSPAECLGEMLICPTYVAQRYKSPLALQLRLRRLLVHGYCHLLGYDHETPKDFTTMLRLETRLTKHLQSDKSLKLAGKSLVSLQYMYRLNRNKA